MENKNCSIGQLAEHHWAHRPGHSDIIKILKQRADHVLKKISVINKIKKKN